MRIVIKTLGCKANRYESDKILEKFADKFDIFDAQTHDAVHADLIIVNTCTVTHVADRKSRQAISNLKSKYPDASVIVFGCGTNIDKDGYKKLKNVDYVVQKREDLYNLLEKIKNKSDRIYENKKLTSNRTRALVKIQDGCNNFCSYCIVPFARGRQVSRTSKKILEEINKKISQDYKEIVLTGINIGEWKEGRKDLADLINLILDKTNVQRLRLSSIEPQNFSDKFIQLFKNPRFCPHLHISLQSGSDKILKAMKRRYDTNLFTKIIKRLHKAVPQINITTDIIVGFPGETEELFQETLEYIKKIEFSKIHIFPYSKRKGTIAAEMPNQIPYKIKKERCKRLARVEKQMRRNFYEKNIGKKEEILFESLNKDEFYTGFTSNYLKTRIHKNTDKDLTNTIQNVLLEKVNSDCEIVGALKS